MTTARRTLTTASLGTLTTLVAFTAPLATVNQTVAGLGAGASGRTWVLSSMSIGLGAFLLTAGRIADDYGRRRTFVVGALVLALGAVVAAVATDVEVFVVARVVQGIGGAAMIAASLGNGRGDVPRPARASARDGRLGRERGRGHRTRAAAVGRVGEGRLVARRVRRAAGGGHRAGRSTARGCPESRGTERARLDVPGVVLLVVGISAGLAGLTEGREGWGRPLVIGLLAASVVLLAAFLFVEQRSDHPMLDLGLFRRPAFAAVTLAAVATGAGIIALLSYVSGFVGAALGLSSWTASWLMLAWSGPSIVTALGARRLPVRVVGAAPGCPRPWS